MRSRRSLAATRCSWCWMLALSCGLAASAARAQRAEELAMPGPLPPGEALESFQVEPGLRVVLAASEPLVADPVAVDWDGQGRLWVVEMGDYPSGTPGQPGGGRVKVLTDQDGDWTYDEAAVFLDGLPFPTGLKVWRDGVLITAAPDVLFARDADGDGKADQVLKLFSGFGEGNQQHRVNGLRLGLDGWLHLANGDSGGSVTFQPVTAEQPTVTNISGRDVRIDPDRRRLETVSGATQFGRVRNDWGDWFGGDNSNPLRHYPLREDIVARNPRVAPPSTRIDVPQEPGASPVYPISRTLPRFNDLDRANRFTSACGPDIYRDDWLGEAWRGDALVCEPVHNLVRHEVVRRQGVSFRSRPAEAGREFLASSDNWFRPVMARTGPDGAVWIVDMYRLVIEHPEWIPRTWQDRLDLRSGATQGRIYRVVREDRGGRSPEALAGLASQSPPQWIELLAHPNGVLRDLAHQHLLWRLRPEPRTAGDEPQGGDAIVASLRAAARQGPPWARLHALCLLGCCDLADDEDLAAALRDDDPAVRRWAARWTDARLREAAGAAAGAAPPARAALVAALVDCLRESLEGGHPTVAMESSAALRWAAPADAAGPLADVLATVDEPYVATFALSALHEGNVGEVARRVLQRSSGESAWLAPILRTLADAGGEAMLEQLLHRTLDDLAAASPQAPANWSALAALVQAMESRQAQYLGRLDAARSRSWSELLERAATQLGQPDASEAELLAAANWLGAVEQWPETVADAVAACLDARYPDRVQQAAVAALSRLERPGVEEHLLRNWPQATPPLREALQTALLSRTPWARAALRAARDGRVNASLWSARTRQMALAHRDPEARELARSVWDEPDPDARRQLAVEARSCLTLHSDLQRGQEVFRKRCASCHQLHGQGHALGPDLAALSDRSPHALLTAILAPNAAVEDKYQDYLVQLADGRQVSGLLVEENANALVLGGADGKRWTVLRQDLELVQATGKSLMPEGLERDMPPQELADLIAFLRSIGPPPKPFVGNLPSTPAEPVAANEQGAILLTAARARIFGPNLMFEPRHENLGFWRTGQDYAEWSLTTPQAGTYRVVVRYACDQRSAGNTLELRIADQRLQWTVPGVARDWDTYREVEIGRLELPAGPADARLSALGAVGGYAADIQAVELRP